MSGKQAAGAGRRTLAPIRESSEAPKASNASKASKGNAAVRGGGQGRSALTPTELKQAALAERRKREAAAGVGEGDLSHGRPPASSANRNRYWQEAKNGDQKPVPVPANAWKNTLTKKAHPREPAAAGQPPAPAANHTPTGLAKSLIGNSQPRKQHMSENAVNFFKHGGYLEMFKDELEAIYTGVDTSNPPLDIRAQKQHFTQVYLVFRKMFGVMLGECRKNTIMLWKRKATLDESDVSKKKFREIIDEAAALWHAVVHEFRKTCSDLKDTFHKYNLNVFEDEGGPVHHLNYLHVYSTYGITEDVMQGRWGRWNANIRKEFADNAVHLVREYQLLLAARLSSTEFKTFHFAFYFMPRDLFRWVNDLHDCAELGQQTARQKALTENRKMFVWPEVCQKGKKLDAPFTLAYKTFCNQMGLNKFHYPSQTEFRVRVRAAWQRLVACYPFEHGLSPSIEDVTEYLKKAHVEEVDLQPTNASSGPRTTVIPVKEEDWSILPGGSHWGKEEQRRRVLVYGAPMGCAGAAANPYLCH
jgi:hypothetical protein